MPSSAEARAGVAAGLTEERIGWVSREDGRERPIPVGAVAARASSPAAGLRVEITHSEPGELPEGHVPRHVVVLNLRRTIRTETWWVGERRRGEVPIAPGRASLFPAGAPYVTRWRDPLDNVLVELSPLALDGLAANGAPARRALRPALGADDPLLAHVVLELAELARRGGPPGSLHEQTLTAALAAHLLRRYGGAPGADAPRAGGLSRGQLLRITAFVDDHLGGPITLPDLAAAIGTSVFHLAHAFKASTGAAPHQYVLRRRIDRAKELLRGTALPVGEIAVRCGFSHASHFTSTFQRVLGTTPSRYRQLATGAS